jgi:3-oxoacyl-[acyl-carrier-protein] synthase-3
MSGEKFQLPFASRITGTGSAFPEMRRSNNDLKQFMETDDEWIRERTGIRERRVSNTKNEAEVNSSLGLRAALQALEMAGKKAEDIDQIIYGTCSGDKKIRRKTRRCDGRERGLFGLCLFFIAC